ncbi:unnamed protein product, partial [Iphiclides podalirius]
MAAAREHRQAYGRGARGLYFRPPRRLSEPLLKQIDAASLDHELTRVSGPRILNSGDLDGGGGGVKINNAPRTAPLAAVCKHGRDNRPQIKHLGAHSGRPSPIAHRPSPSDTYASRAMRPSALGKANGPEATAAPERNTSFAN